MRRCREPSRGLLGACLMPRAVQREDQPRRDAADEDRSVAAWLHSPRAPRQTASRPHRLAGRPKRAGVGRHRRAVLDATLDRAHPRAPTPRRRRALGGLGAQVRANHDPIQGRCSATGARARASGKAHPRGRARDSPGDRRAGTARVGSLRTQRHDARELTRNAPLSTAWLRPEPEPRLHRGGSFELGHGAVASSESGHGLGARVHPRPSCAATVARNSR